jgi:putative transposase
MTRLPRSALPAYGVFHVTVRGVDRGPIVLDDRDRERWLALRRDSAARFGLVTHAYCLMTNHYHLVVESAMHQISLALHRLNGGYAVGFNRRHLRSGHLYGQRPQLRTIESDEYLHAACAYVRANPVRAGLCSRPGDWRWAGSDVYAGAADGRCTGASAGAHEQSGEESPPRPLRLR